MVVYYQRVATTYRPLNIAPTGCPETSETTIQRCEKKIPE